MNLFIFLSVCLTLAAAAVIDLRTQRIPNALTIPFALIALTLHTANQGPSGLWFGLEGLGLGLALMLVPFLCGVMGGGDVKLLAAVGAWVGPHTIFEAFLFTSLAGGLYALAVLARRADVIRGVFNRLWTTLCVSAGTGEFQYQAEPAAGGLPGLCYGLAIAAGCVVAMPRAGLADGWPGLAR
jgi:prepilin peptidase CpaA